MDKRYLIINKLQISAWPRPDKSTERTNAQQDGTPETLTSHERAKE